MQDESPNKQGLATDTIRRYRDKAVGELLKDEKYSSDVILRAGVKVFKDIMGYPNASKVLKHLIKDPEHFGDSLAEFLENPPPPPVQKMTPLEGLGFMLHHEESKFDMQSIKKVSKVCNADFLPCYDYISAAKKDCRPPVGKKHAFKK